jgi:hypothetical protein
LGGHIQAAIKLAINKGVPVVGTIAPDWHDALRAEFSKEYFTKVEKLGVCA